MGNSNAGAARVATPAPSASPRVAAAAAADASYETPFDFVTALAKELSGGTIDLPSFPDVAVRIRKLLASEKANIADLVRIVGSEPALAVRLMKLANSAALNTSGSAITELRSAIARMGFNMVRSASISFAMAQVNSSKELKVFEAELRRLWQTSTHVAALAYVLAKRQGRANPDEAFLAGLVHGIGRLYVLARIPRFPKLRDDAAAVATIMQDWHASVAKAILENWEMSEALVEAVASQDDRDYQHPGQANLADVLIAATQITEHLDTPDDLAATMADTRSFAALGLTAGNCGSLLVESQAEIDALRQAISG
jgi:HD-like signal output (HDOD) protein